MTEYIEREALLRSQQWERLILDFDREAARGIISSRPAADVTPVVHGKWVGQVIEVSDLDGDWLAMKYHCSLCGRVEYRKEPYCHCGAKMDGERTTNV